MTTTTTKITTTTITTFGFHGLLFPSYSKLGQDLRSELVQMQVSFTILPITQSRMSKDQSSTQILSIFYHNWKQQIETYKESINLCYHSSLNKIHVLSDIYSVFYICIRSLTVHYTELGKLQAHM